MEKKGGDLILEKLAEIRGQNNNPEKPIENIFETSNWNLFSDGKELKPLKFSNRKTQEDIVREVCDLIKQGNKVILVKGVCGTGKSAIALNIARKMGRASIVVPFKTLQSQYEKDYTSNKYLLKANGEKLRITVISGRDNHDSLIIPGASCADPKLPENIKISEKNFKELKRYYDENPFISSSSTFGSDLKNVKRISIAPSNPYWSPILPAGREVYLPDAKKKKYEGLNGQDFIFYHRKRGCSYYDQYLSYLNSDVIVFNSAKYKIETDLNRKPKTDVEIIDEADEFLDSFSSQKNLNLTRLATALSSVVSDNREVEEAIKSIERAIKMDEVNKKALGVDEDKIYSLEETPIYKVIKTYLEHPEIEEEIMYDETNYANHLIDVVKTFKDFLGETYLTYRKYEDELIASLVTTNLSKKFNEIVNKNHAVVLMSGTFHSDIILREVFGIKEYKIVEAETEFPGTIEILRTGKEFDCKYSNFRAGAHTREDYINSLSECMRKSEKPTLVHVNAFEDLPNKDEVTKLEIRNIISKEDLRNLQSTDRNNNAIEIFKAGLNPVLFTTKCSRGADFPGETCNSIVFTKYPNPNPNETFWKILKKTHSKYFWEFYKDKATREFLQKIYRGLRFKEDKVKILSPDMRVLEAVREIQLSNYKNK